MHGELEAPKPGQKTSHPPSAPAPQFLYVQNMRRPGGYLHHRGQAEPQLDSARGIRGSQQDKRTPCRKPVDLCALHSRAQSVEAGRSTGHRAHVAAHVGDCSLKWIAAAQRRPMAFPARLRLLICEGSSLLQGDVLRDEGLSSHSAGLLPDSAALPHRRTAGSHLAPNCRCRRAPPIAETTPRYRQCSRLPCRPPL